MNTNMFALASDLSDHDLLDRIVALAGKERETSAELVAHLAALDARPSLYASRGYGSLFSYCTQALRLSEDATCNRIDAARAARRFPMILDLLASGAVSLATVRMLRPHLTEENHVAVLTKATGRSRQDVLELIAELAPRPDVPSSVRKLPAALPAAMASVPVAPAPAVAAVPPVEPAPSILTPPLVPRSVIEPTSPGAIASSSPWQGRDQLRRLRRSSVARPERRPGDLRSSGHCSSRRVERAKIGAAASASYPSGTDESHATSE
jgi:hypothetical protein